MTCLFVRCKAVFQGGSMLVFTQRHRFRILTSRYVALLIVCALIFSLCGLLTIAPPAAHAASPGPLVTAIDAGGGASGNFIADTYYDTGNAYSDTSTAINTSGVSNPAPQSVWQTCRWN